MALPYLNLYVFQFHFGAIVYFAAGIYLMYAMFQFQYGSIQTVGEFAARLKEATFQFLNGAIQSL